MHSIANRRMKVQILSQVLNYIYLQNGYDGMADMLDSKFSAFNSMRVQVPLSAIEYIFYRIHFL